jgi:hypothetical protein
VACLRLFEAVHPGAVSDNVGNHPNAFFNSSFEYIKAIEKKNKKTGGPQAGSSAAQGTTNPVAVTDGAENPSAAADVEMS